MRTKSLWIAVLFAAMPLVAQEKQTEHTVRLGSAKPEAARIEEMAWLAGRWTGDGLGGWTEEIWTAPKGGAMIGTFRLLRDDKPVFYEIMTLLITEKGLAMRLKHVNPDMTGWEQKDEFVEFLYVRTVGKLVQFEGLTFERESADAMTIYLALRDTKSGQVSEAKFSMQRDAERRRPAG